MKIELESRETTAGEAESSRRHFCQAAALGVLGALIQGCGGSSPASPSNVSALPVLTGTAGTNSITLTVDGSSPLATVGNAAMVQASGGAVVLVARTGQSSFTAVSATCTHQACQITGFTGSAYVCPCHGSQFSTAGQVLGGPAPSNLRVFSTQFAGNVLTITA